MPASTLRRRPVPLLIPVVLALLLAACQGPQGRGPVARPGDPPEDETAGLQIPPPGARGADPAGLRGLSAPEVVAKLGDPGYRRRDAPAEVWQYFGPGCVLDVFLYDGDAGPRVNHVELRSRNPTPAGQAACLSQILQGRKAAAPGGGG